MRGRGEQGVGTENEEEKMGRARELMSGPETATIRFTLTNWKKGASRIVRADFVRATLYVHGFCTYNSNLARTKQAVIGFMFTTSVLAGLNIYSMYILTR